MSSSRPQESRGTTVLMNHYTNKKGYDSIRATVDWCFKAGQPPASEHPIGAYFTTLSPHTPNLANRLRVPREKISHVFSFIDAYDLIPLRGGRGEYVFYSPVDYVVLKARQILAGKREEQR